MLEADIGHIDEDWEDLAAATGASPFQRPGWHRAWWESFGRGRLEIAVLVDDVGPAALLPLARRHGRLVSPVNWHTPLHGPVSRDPDAERELFRRLFELPERAFDLWPLDEQGETIDIAATAAHEAGRFVQRRHVYTSPFIPLDRDWADVEGGISKNRRKSIRRRRQALARDGHLRFDVDDGRDDLEHAFQELLDVEASGWKGHEGTAIASRRNTRAFYREVAGWARDRGWLRLAFLRLDGKAIAAELALEQGGRWYSLKAGYSASHARYGPGSLLLHAAARHAWERGLNRYELLGPLDGFKASFAPETRGIGWLGAYARSPYGRAENAAARLRDHLRALRAAADRRRQ